MATVEQYLAVLAGAQAAQNAEAQRAAAQMQIELKSGDPRVAVSTSVALVARGRPLEARHFGYGVLQHVCAERWDEFAADERQHLAKLAWEKLTELVAGAAGDAGGSAAAPEPFVIKSAAATLLATVVRREGAAVWAGVVPDLCAMTSSADADAAELAALVTRYVAEDVAVYNSDIIGGRMKDLLGGLAATLPQTLPALYRGLEVHFSSALSFSSAGDAARAKRHAAAVSASLSAAAVYGEWAPLASVARSGILDACGHFLSSAEFRAPACEVLRHVASRRRGDAINDAIRARREGDGGGGEAASGVSLDAAQAEAASDAEAVVNGFAGMCRSLGVAASRVLAAPAADPGSDELEYVVRLTETVATLATNHGSTLEDRGLRAAFLEALLGLTVYPSLDVLGAAVQAWPALLRGSGAELPGTFVKPEKAAQSGVWGAAQQRKQHESSQQRGEQHRSAPSSGSHALPDGAVAALLDASSVWLQRGGGLATGLATRHAPGSSADEWEESAGFESREELREAWVGLRARLMEVTKLCAALDPAAAAAKARDRVDATLRATAPGGPLEAAKVNAEFAASAGANAGRAALDDGLGAALEGATAFAESVIQTLPLPVFGEDGFGGGFGSGGAEGSGRGGLAAAEAFAPALEAMLTNALAAATSVRTPVSVSQMSRLLEALGRVALVRPDAGPAIMRRLFEMLAALPADDVQAPPARAKAAVAAGRTAQAARQRVCAAVLGVCAAAPKVFNAHLEAFAGQVESLRSSGQLSGAERGALAEALLAVAGPSGPARVREVLRWLLEPVRRRWFPAQGGPDAVGGAAATASPEVSRLASAEALAEGENVPGGGHSGLSAAHWDLFHDVQLTERCLRRSGGDHDPSEAADKDGGLLNGIPTTGGVFANGSNAASGAAALAPRLPSPAGIVRPVETPPPAEECPASDHLEWVLALCEALCASIAAHWTPAGADRLRALGLRAALAMSPEEQAAHLVHGPARSFALAGGGAPPASATAAAARDWLRGLRDSAHACVALLAQHAPGAFYPNPAVASATARIAYADLEHARDRHARAAIHAVARPTLGRCPSAHRAAWHAALTAALVPHMHRRLGEAWARVAERQREDRERGVDVEGGGFDFQDAISGGAGAATGGNGRQPPNIRGDDNTGGGAEALEDLIAERVTRDLARDHCALLELIAIPEGTFGRKTKSGGLTGHLRGAVEGAAAGASGSSISSTPPHAHAHAGGQHMRSWFAAVAGVNPACAYSGVATACAAVRWGDSESTGRAVGFLRGVVFAAAAFSPESSSTLDRAIRDVAGAEILPAALAALTVPTNSSHQAELLGVVRDVVLHLTPVTPSVRATLLSLPGLSADELDRTLLDLANLRSEKKAAQRVKEMLVKAAGGGDALRAFAEARAGAAGGAGAIQVPSFSAARGGGERTRIPTGARRTSTP